MSRHVDSSTTTQMAKSMVQYGRPVVTLQGNLYGHPLAGLLWERQFEKVLLKIRLGKFPNENVYSLNEKKYYSCLWSWTTKKLAGKISVKPTWKILMQDVDLGEPTSFLHNVYWWCTQRECKISNEIVANYRDVFESRISAGAKEKLPTRTSGKPDAETISGWSYDMEGLRKKCVERYCELASKTTQQFFKVATPCIDDQKFKGRRRNGICRRIVKGLFTKCSEMPLFGPYWWTWYFCCLWTNLLVLSLRGLRMWQTLITFDLLHSSHMWIQTMRSCGKYITTMQIRNGQDFDFAGDPEDSKSTSGGILCIFGSHTFVPTSWMCKKTDFSLTQFCRSWNGFSLDPGLRMVGITALDLWDLVTEVFYSGPNQFSNTKDQSTRKSRRVTPHQTSTLKTELKFQPSTTILIWAMLTTCDAVYFWGQRSLG